MTRTFFIIALLFTTFCFGQKKRKNSILVAEYQKNDEGIGNYTHLVSYNFIDGELTSKDTILSAPTSKGQYQGSYVRYDLGHNFIYKNRYVISGIGNVIDVQTKSLVMEESDDLIELRGDSIIFHRNNIITGTGYLICDLKSRNYGFVKNKGFLKSKGIHSPNHLLGLEIDKSEFPYKIVLYDKRNRQDIMVNDCGYGTNLSSYASTRPNIPLFWLDNQHFLYASYSYSGYRSDSIKSTVTINKVSIDKKSSEIVAKIDSVPPAISRSSFSLDPDKTIIFHCAKGQFEINTDKKQASLYKRSSIGNNFSIENNRNDKYGRIIIYKDKEIGRIWCDSYNAKTTSGFIGVEYGEFGSNLGYPRGVKVWNNYTKDWLEIKIPWIAGIIGWIE